MATATGRKPSYGREPTPSASPPRLHLRPARGSETLVAYLWLYRCGELALVSTILGHADLLEEGIMYGLFAGMLEAQFRLAGRASTTASTPAPRAFASSRSGSASRGRRRVDALPSLSTDEGLLYPREALQGLGRLSWASARVSWARRTALDQGGGPRRDRRRHGRRAPVRDGRSLSPDEWDFVCGRRLRLRGAALRRGA